MIFPSSLRYDVVTGKPKPVSHFLEDVLSEYKSLIETGIEIENSTMAFEIKCFSCDAPARQFLKCTKGHTGYYSCERCTVKGEKHESTMTFEDTSAPLRNEIDFNACNYSDHKHEESVLIPCEIPCISKFVLDHMHLVCLGVVRRMLNFLQSGPRNCKLSQNQLCIISNHWFP